MQSYNGQMQLYNSIFYLLFIAPSSLRVAGLFIYNDTKSVCLRTLWWTALLKKGYHCKKLQIFDTKTALNCSTLSYVKSKLIFACIYLEVVRVSVLWEMKQVTKIHF